LYGYSRITAPFAGVVTQRYANLGTLLQAGTSSSTQAMPLVRLSQDQLFRLVIPVPESYVRYVHVGDPVQVRVPSLDRSFPGKVTRFSVDVQEDTRTMHTEVDISNPDHVLIPGVYAEATLSLDRKDHAVSVPLQAVSRNGDRTIVDIVDANHKVQERNVKLGIQTATDAEVLSGLQVGDQVVVSDRSGFRPGETVQTKPVDLVQSDVETAQ
ncbi:MAG TPA: efflux RND transporter periplasmic adaptor subunit, partial [Vicinamibacterales bacterium]|nr:efflux RND transporter periplasmic adaptor subunit [Vicinamibacterales bacterium]